MIPALPHIAAMAPYALADLAAPPGKTLLSLAQNESLRPPSPKAIRAVRATLGLAQLYPDPEWTDLRIALARHHSVAPDRILCAAGSLDLIGALARAYLGPGLAALAPAHAYPFFQTATQLTGARFDIAPSQGLAADVDALLATVRPETRLLFLANPGNPTGTRLPRAEIQRLREGLPSDILLVLDEAYGEFADHLGEPMFDLVARGDTVILRTFSKAHGLAGLRVGWGLFAPSVAGELRKILGPNGVTAASQAAARASLEDVDYVQATCAQTATTRDGFAKRMRAAGLEVPDSFTNFCLLRFPDAPKAASADAALRAEGIFLRAQTGAGLPDYLRATIGTEAQMGTVAQKLEQWIAKGGLS